MPHGRQNPRPRCGPGARHRAWANGGRIVKDRSGRIGDADPHRPWPAKHSRLERRVPGKGPRRLHSPRRSRYFGHKTILHNDLCEIVKIQTIFPPRRALQLIARSLNLPMSSDFHRSVPTRPPRSTAEASDGAIPANSSPTSLLFIAAAAVSPVDRPRAALAGERPRRPPWANPGA
jgi:hypothetical protein